MDYMKVVLSLLGVFLFGFSGAYQLTPEGPIVNHIMAGIGALAPYLVGLYQMTPGKVEKG